jgi:gliding motility-associated-like protein
MRLRWTLACLTLLFYQFPTFGQVVVNFSTSNNSGCGTVNAHFTDQSTSSNGAIVSWSWNFGGSTSNVQHPGHFFTTPGSYTICLTVTDVTGAQGTLCKNNYIVVHALPSPNFNVTPAAGCNPLTVVFSDNSTAAGNIVKWTWGLGGSAGVVINTTNANVSSTYNLSGNYAVNLTIQDEYGCSNTTTKTNAVAVSNPPNIDVSANQTFSCYPPFQVDFSNNNIQAGVTYTWNFGNGITFVGPNPPAINYSQSGSYTVKVSAVTASGCTFEKVLEDYINVGMPASFTYSPTSGCEELTVIFDDTSPNSADSVWWDFGDGTSSTDFEPTHTYMDQGCYDVSLVRYANGGCITSINSTNCIQVFSKPEFTIDVDKPIACIVPHTVQFQANQAGLTQWFWDFGDGNTSTASSPSHTYTSIGNYTVTLNVTNLFECTSTITAQEIVIFDFTCQAIADNEFGCTPLTVNLSSTSNSLVPVTNWDWTLLNDGFSPTIEVSGSGSSTDLMLVDTGLYDIRLITTNELGCMDTVIYKNDVGVGIPPVIDFSANMDTACVNEGISFTDGSSSFATAWRWSFGDGTTSAEQNPDHEYTALGFYDVTLKAIHHGCDNELKREDFIYIDPPLAGFNIVTNCINHYSISIENTSTGATSLLYNFGVPNTNTDTSSHPTPQFLYPGPGLYTITQIVANNITGCADTLRQNVTIGIPDALISLTPKTGCVPLTVKITDNSTFASQYNYQILSGGGVISNPNASAPTILFSNPGVYSGIKLNITDVNGCQDSIIMADSIYANAVISNFDIAPVAGCRPLNINLTDSSSSVFGNINQWQWNIPGALSSPLTVQHPNYTITQNGTFDVSLKVTDDWGCTNTFVIDDGIYVTFPTAKFTTPDTIGCTQSTVDFKNLSLGDGLTYSWNFGDGNTSTLKDPTHYYAQEGVYTVCLTVVDVNGCQHYDCKTDYIVIANPIALFESDLTYGACPPLLINFENHSQNSSYYEWDFDDASGSSNLENPAHIYTSPGVFSVNLIAFSTAKCKDTLLLEDIITLEGPVGSFQINKDTACVPATITFTGISIAPYNFYWDFGNGNIDSTLLTTMDSFDFSYYDAGRFIPKLILEDQAGCSIIYESTDTITIAFLEPDFIAIDTALCEGEQTTTFINLSNSSDPISFTEWYFEGGDPESSNFGNVGINYFDFGDFDVQLVVSNGICRDTLLKNDYIGVGTNPVADFSYTPATGCVPFSVQFTDLSTVEEGIINQWDWNFVDVGTSDDQNPTQLFTQGNGSLQKIEFMVTTEEGCVDSKTVYIPTLPLPAANISALPTLCKGEPAVLSPIITTDPTGMTYQWTGDNSLSCTDCLNPGIAPQDTTVYELLLTNIFGCTTTVMTTVNVLPDSVPALTLTPDTSICYNSLIQIAAGGGDHLNAYQWDPSSPGLSCYEACFNPVANPLTNTTYYLTVTNLSGCSAMDSILIEVVNDSYPIAGDDRVICLGDSVQLSLSFGVDPTWIEADGLTCAYCSDPIASPNQDMQYVVEAFTDIGCKIIDTVIVVVMTAADFSAGEDQVICAGENIILEGESEGGTPTWSPANTLTDPTIWKPTANPTATTNYIMTVERDLCIASDTVEIQVVHQTEIWGRDTTICEGDEVLLEVFGDADTYQWTPSEFLSDLNSQSTWAKPERTTTFVVTGQLATCAEDTASFKVTINKLPAIHTAPIRYYVPGENITLSVIPTEDNTNPLSYEWMPPVGLSCRYCSTPSVSPMADIVYTVTAIDSIYGCSSEREVSVEGLYNCPEELFGVPNVFSPNGDGINDVLELKLSPSVQEIVSFQIYNRWGALVFQTDDRYDGWDGTVNGKSLNDGVYIYVLEAICPIDGSVIMKKGDVTILK